MRIGVTAFLLMVVFPIPVLGQSILNFPRAFTSTDLMSTGFAIVNSGAATATVTFTLYNSTGQVVSTSLQTVSGGGQLAKLGAGANELFQNPSSGGWIQAVSAAAGLQGLWLGGDFATLTDGAEAAPAARDLVFPLVTEEMELSIANPNTSTASFAIRLFGANGLELGSTVTQSIVGRGVFQRSLSALFPSANLSQPAHIRISSAMPVSGTAVLTNFLASPSWAVINGVDASVTVSEANFPHVPSGALGATNWLSVVGISNLWTTNQTVTITFTPSAGADTAPISARRTIPPNGLLREPARSLFELSSTYRQGWVRVSGMGPIAGFVAYSENSAAGVAVVPMQAAPRTNLAFAHVADGAPQWSTGLALLNTTATNANVEVFVMRRDGTLVGGPFNAPATARFALNAGTSRTALLSEFVPESRFNDGFVLVHTTNNVPLYGIELFFTRDLKVISNVAAGALAEGTTARPWISDLLEPIRQKYRLPAMAGAIVTGKGLIAIDAVGVRKAGTDITVTAADKWHLGSDTKAMTATLIGALVEQGALRWEMTLEQVFPDFAPSMHSELRRVTFLHLLSHRAGLPANLNWSEISRRGTLREQREMAVQMATSAPPLSPPGTTYEYSNLGYVIAGAMAERVTGELWENLITRILFQPLGMSQAGFGGTGTPGQVDQPWPHNADGTPTATNGPTVDNRPVLGPAGTVHSSLAAWGRYIADQLLGARGARALLQPETYKKLHTPPFSGDYALGWITAQRSWGGGTVLTHAGSNTLNYSVTWVAPLRDFAVLVSANQGGDAAARACDEAASALIAFYSQRR